MGKKAKAFVHCCAALIVLSFAGAAQASVAISSSPTKNMNCSAGVCAPTAKDAVLNVSDLTNLLATEDVKIVTGAGAVTITTFSPFSWTSAHRLTLDANQSVTFRAPVTVAGTGAVSIVTNDGGTGGDLIFFPGAKLDFWDTSSTLIINGNRYGLVKDIATLSHADATGHIAPANDYDASVDGTYTSSPVTAMFQGTLEGLGHSISNFTLAGDGALFANSSGTFRDLGMTNVSINASYSGAALVATDYGVTIIGCAASGNIVSAVWAGGLIGTVRDTDVQSTILRSHANVSLTAEAAGGLAGVSAFGTITDSYAVGTITGGDNAFLGGLVGELIFSSISQSFTNVDVTGGRSSTVGGLVGGGGVQGYPAVLNSYSTGSVSAHNESKIGGFVGELGGTVQYSYENGHVQGGHSGGFVGQLDQGGYRSFRNYWDVESSGKSGKHCSGDGGCGRRIIRGLKTAEFKSGLPEGFDPSIWGQSATINNGYPYLLANPPPQ